MGARGMNHLVAGRAAVLPRRGYGRLLLAGLGLVGLTVTRDSAANRQ